MSAICGEVILEGTPICRGIAIGRPFYFKLTEDAVDETSIGTIGVDAEVKRYRLALSKGREEVKKLHKRLLLEKIAEGAAILDGHLQMMEDPLLTTEVEDTIRGTLKSADVAFQSVIGEYQKKCESVSDPFFRERYKEIGEISRRIMRHLHNSSAAGLAQIPKESIVFAEDLTSIDTAEAEAGAVMAFITRSGGAASHAAIVAKAKGIPYVTSIDFEGLTIRKDGWVIVDGRTGKIIINPTSETLTKYQHMRDQLQSHVAALSKGGKLEAETYDGYKVQLSANTEMHSELDLLHEYGGGGVGLYRTESAFLYRETFPSEEEQFEIYRDFVKRMNGLPIVIRTFDLGGDKYLKNRHFEREGNPFLGCRAIRFSLREKEVFKSQLRAILRAGAYGNVKVLFPMVSALSELLEAKAVLEEARRELIQRGEKIPDRMPIGCMIEVPSAAIIADLLAKECDFLSIGTNDLVQYALAVDRSNDSLSKLYTPTHPGVLRLIRLVVSEANHHGIPVTVCGEVAADPRFAPLLLGLGVHELSVASRYLPTVKHAIRNTSIVAASKLAEKALTLSTASEVEELITREYRKNVPEDCFYNC